MDDTLLSIIYIAGFIPQHLLVHFKVELSERSGGSLWEINTYVI